MPAHPSRRSSARRLVPALAVAIALAACGGEVTRVVPEGWDTHESTDLGYVMGHPADWEVAHEAATAEDVYIGPDGAEIRVSALVVEEGWAADILFQAAEDDAAARYGTPPMVVNELTLAGGARVLIFANEYTDDRGAFLFQRAVVLVPPTELWYLDWSSDVGDEGGDRQRFTEFVRSFVPAPLLPGVQEG